MTITKCLPRKFFLIFPIRRHIWTPWSQPVERSTLFKVQEPFCKICGVREETVS